MTLAKVDYQFLAALARFGRRAIVRQLESLAGSPSNNPSAQTSSPMSLLDKSSRSALLRSLGSEPLPWQALKDQMERSDTTALFFAQLPAALQQIPDPPLALYAQGNIERLAEPAVAMVGARRSTRRSQQWSEQTAGQLSALGLTVVSGMAFGIDAAAHRGALSSGRTIAVLGSGLLRPSPRSHAALMRAILERDGLVVSEYPLTQEARKYSFPERNRLVTGLALGVVIVEAGYRSGSLISARLALEQGRDVMAVPGPVGIPGSVGCHRLLKQGAALVENAADIVQVLDLERLMTPPNPSAEALAKQPSTSIEAGDQALANRVLSLLDALPISVDVLVANTGSNPAALAAALTRLELDGFVQRQGEGYIRSP